MYKILQKKYEVGSCFLFHYQTFFQAHVRFRDITLFPMQTFAFIEKSRLEKKESLFLILKNKINKYLLMFELQSIRRGHRTIQIA